MRVVKKYQQGLGFKLPPPLISWVRVMARVCAVSPDHYNVLSCLQYHTNIIKYYFIRTCSIPVLSKTYKNALVRGSLCIHWKYYIR